MTYFNKEKDKNMGTVGKIAGGHKETVDSARNILKDGGNAFDAAVAGVFSSLVCEYLYTSAAGGGAMLACKNNGAPVLFDFFVETPKIKKERVSDFEKIIADFGDTKQAFHVGWGSVGVPGVLPGLIHVHKKLGSLPFRVLVEQAVEAAKSGVKVSKNQEYLTEVLRPVISSSDEIKNLFLKDGKLLRYGDRFYNKKLSSFLSSFLYEDPEPFYKNEVCPLFHDSLSQGGIINLSDLQNYQVKERKPLSKKYKQHTIFTNPSPSTGGQTVLAGLDVLVDKKAVGPYELEEALLAANKKNSRAASPVGSTTHLSIVDKENNVVSITTTNGCGSGRAIPGTGIMPNNMLGEEHLNPGGFHVWKKQSRIPSNIAPTVLFKEKRPVVALGSAGSSRIISAILCTLSNLVNNKMDLASAIESPRIHIEGDTLHHEPFDGGAVFLDFKTKNVVSWKEKNMYFGGVNAAGTSSAFGDNRRSGYSY